MMADVSRQSVYNEVTHWVCTHRLQPLMRRVAELGADAVITGRCGREGQLLVDEINRNGGSADFIQADLTRPDHVRLVVPFTLKAFGRLDYAFNNAGIPGNNRSLSTTISE